MKKQKKGKLYLIPTPLADNSLEKMVTPQLTVVMKSTNYFLAENLRTARRFMSSLKLGRTIEDIYFDVLDKNTSLANMDQLCAPLFKGEDMGVMSEAGCPGIADPGNLAVTFAHQHNIEVVPLVGPSSIFMALMASGLNGQSFVFHGYLPIEKAERVKKIKEIEKNIFSNNQTQIFMETPFRNNHLFADLLKHCHPATRLCVAKDVNGDKEMIRTLTVKEWKKTIPELHKIPVVFLIYR